MQTRRSADYQLRYKVLLTAGSHKFTLIKLAARWISTQIWVDVVQACARISLVMPTEGVCMPKTSTQQIASELF